MSQKRMGLPRPEGDTEPEGERFQQTLQHILTIDKPEMERREAEYQRIRATKVPRGPQPGRSYRRKTA